MAATLIAGVEERVDDLKRELVPPTGEYDSLRTGAYRVRHAR
jgi:hypothetical protein